MSDTEDNTKKGRSASEQMRLDRESKLILHQGASIGQLHLLFDRDKRTIQAKIAGNVEPCGMRAGFPIYRVKDVAPYLVPPVGDFEESIKKMHHDDIPPLLHRNYWAGKRERLKFEEEEGRLVDVFEASELIAKAFQNARMSILLMPDAIEREFVLSDEHRAALKRLVDGLIEEIRTNLVEAFQTPGESSGEDQAHDEDGEVFDPVVEDDFHGL